MCPSQVLGCLGPRAMVLCSTFTEELGVLQPKPSQPLLPEAPSGVAWPGSGNAEERLTFRSACFRVCMQPKDGKDEDTSGHFVCYYCTQCQNWDNSGCQLHTAP